MNWHVLSEANSEVIAATLWYDEQRLGLGDEFLVELQNTYEIIKRQPALLPRLEKYTGPHEIRRCLLQRFPYVVIVLCRDDDLFIVAVAHTRRRPHYWLNRI